MENNETINKEINDTIIEKNIHRTNLKRFLHTLCLIFPVACAFGGLPLSDLLWKIIKKTTAENHSVPELFTFFVVLVVFFISSAIVYFSTRSEKSVIDIKILKRTK